MLQTARRSWEQQGVESGAPDISFCNLDSEIYVIYVSPLLRKMRESVCSLSSAILLKFKVDFVQLCIWGSSKFITKWDHREICTDANTTIREYYRSIVYTVVYTMQWKMLNVSRIGIIQNSAFTKRKDEERREEERIGAEGRQGWRDGRINEAK